MIIESKVIELFCMSDDLALLIFYFASFFDVFMTNIKIWPTNIRKRKN